MFTKKIPVYFSPSCSRALGSAGPVFPFCRRRTFRCWSQLDWADSKKPATSKRGKVHYKKILQDGPIFFINTHIDVLGKNVGGGGLGIRQIVGNITTECSEGRQIAL